MRKALTLAILGTALMAPAGTRAQTAPAFIGATACEAAASLRAGTLATRRAVRAEQGLAMRAGRWSAARPERRPAVRADQRRALAASRAGKPAAEYPPIVMEVPDAEDETPTVRRAVHFCVSTPGAGRTWMT